MVYKGRKYHSGDTHLKRRWATKRRTKDLDQIDEDIQPKNAEKLLNQEVDLDKPGFAQHYCVHCARYFITDQALKDHFTTKVHKRRLKALELEPYTVEESERAAGLGSFKLPQKRQIETQPIQETPIKRQKVEKEEHSALYLTGKEASEQFAVLKPVLDFEERMENREGLERNLKLRNSDMDLSKIKSYWDYYKHLENQKVTLENARLEVSRQIARLKENDNREDIDKLVIHGKSLKEELKILKHNIFEIERTAAYNILALPNDIHRRTPDGRDHVIYTFHDKPTKTSQNHVDIAYEKGWLEYVNPSFCYLTGEAAILEQAILDKMTNILLDASFVNFSNSDFTRSIVVEGCGSDLRQVFTLEDIHSENTDNFNRLHLTGSSSLYSFMAYFSRNSVQPSYLPLKFFSTGQKYEARPHKEPSLFNFCKETGTHVFVAVEDDDRACEEHFDELVSHIKLFYESFNCNFRLVYHPAHKLYSNESLHLSIQMYSAHKQAYVEIGNCSIYDNFPSKRLLFTYTMNKIRKYPKIISGSILRFQPLLACLLEHQNVNKDNNLFTNLLKDYTN